jgi:hypothetical protein
MAVSLASVARGIAIALKSLLALAVLLLAIAYWRWLSGQDHEFRSFQATLLSAAADRSLTTSFARVDVFRVLDQEGHWHRVNSFGENADPQRIDLKKLKAFCSWTYDVTVGYPDLRKQATDAAGGSSEFPVPQLLSINTIQATDWGRDAAVQCLKRFEGDSVRAMVKDALVTDRLWELHMQNGAEAFVAASRRVLPECAEGTVCARQALEKRMQDLFALQEPQLQLATRCFGEPEPAESAACEAARLRALGGGARADLPKGEHAELLLEAEGLAPADIAERRPVRVFNVDDTSGYEGTVVLTMSALATMGSERRVRLLWVIPLWMKEAFYFRREIAEITFGTHIGEHSLRKSRLPFFGPKLVLSVADADVISINRRVAAQGYSGDLSELEKAGRSLSSEANAGILEALRTAVAGYADTARALSRTILRDRYESDEVSVEFNEQRTEANATVFFLSS